jgi:hypothetical protein
MVSLALADEIEWARYIEGEEEEEDSGTGAVLR